MKQPGVISLVVAATLVALATGCSKDESPPTGRPSKAGASARSSASAAVVKSKQKGPSVTEAGRKGECRFVAWQGAGKDRKATFAIKVGDQRKAGSVQTWLFYYDKTGKYLERYPHATFPNDEPQALGYDGDKIPKGTETVECELTRISFDDGSTWFNENLYPSGEERPKGGFDTAYLAAHAGERLEVEVLDAKQGKVKLTNVAGKAIKGADVRILYFDDKGELEARGGHVDIALEPGGTAEHKVDLGTEPLKAFKSAEAVAPRVTFADGSEFQNRNLDSSYRRPGG